MIFKRIFVKLLLISNYFKKSTVLKQIFVKFNVKKSYYENKYYKKVRNGKIFIKTEKNKSFS